MRRRILPGSDAIQGLLDFIPTFVIDGFGVAANILPAMGFAMLGRLVLTKQLVPFYFLASCCAPTPTCPSWASP